jgi:prepilin-type N-terminal cleavage/methylation domain-containing protein
MSPPHSLQREASKMAKSNHMPVMHKVVRNGGFTLIEILIAVLITGIIYSFILGVLTTSLNASKEALHNMEMERIGRYFISRISTDISCITLLPMSGLGGLLGKHTVINGKSRDEIHFTAFTRSYFTSRPPANEAEIGYYFITNKEGKDALMRREADIIEKPVTQGGEAYPITDMVEELTIKYLFGNNWVQNWDTENTNLNSLPNEISIELWLNDGKKKYFFSTIVKPMI